MHLFLAVLTLGLLSNSLIAQEPIRMARTPDISPDGKLVAFSYLGDIWVVETIGGKARPVTMHKAHEINPVFSPDGHSIAFSSNRHGSYNVFVIPVESGKPRQLTFDSSNDAVTGWSPDGKQILFSSSRSLRFPPSIELYTVPVEGGRTQRISAAEGREGVFSPKGDRIAYVRGPGTWYRKGYRGSSNDDIWICNADGTNNRQLTTNNVPGRFADVERRRPVDLLRQRVPRHPGQHRPTGGGHGHRSGPPWFHAQRPRRCPCPSRSRIHKDDAVRRARISGNGEWIVYECGADLWVVVDEGRLDAAQAGHRSPHRRQVEHRAHRDLHQQQRHRVYARRPMRNTSSLVVHGELFLAAGYAQRQAAPPDGNQRHTTTASPGRRTVRGCCSSPTAAATTTSICCNPTMPDHPQLINAHQFKTTQLTKGSDAAMGLSFAPDGKRVAFIQAGKLWTMNPDGTDQKVIVHDTKVIDYEWSPDSKWFVYSRMDGSFASELYIVPATGPTAENPARNITRYATYNSDVTWSARRLQDRLSERAPRE